MKTQNILFGLGVLLLGSSIGCTQMGEFFTSMGNQFKSKNSVSQKDMETLLVDAQRAESLNNSIEAEQMYREYIEKMPVEGNEKNIALAYARLGFLAAQRTEYNKSNDYFEKSLALYSGDVNVYGAYGEVLVRQQRYRDAESVLQQGLVSAPNDRRFQLLLGHALAQQGHYGEGLRYLKSAYNNTPNGEQTAYQEMANIYAQHGKTDAAQLAMTKSYDVVSSQQVARSTEIPTYEIQNQLIQLRNEDLAKQGGGNERQLQWARTTGQSTSNPLANASNDHATTESTISQTTVQEHVEQRPGQSVGMPYNQQENDGYAISRAVPQNGAYLLAQNGTGIQQQIPQQQLTVSPQGIPQQNLMLTQNPGYVAEQPGYSLQQSQPYVQMSISDGNAVSGNTTTHQATGNTLSQSTQQSTNQQAIYQIPQYPTNAPGFGDYTQSVSPLMAQNTPLQNGMMSANTSRYTMSQTPVNQAISQQMVNAPAPLTPQSDVSQEHAAMTSGDPSQLAMLPVNNMITTSHGTPQNPLARTQQTQPSGQRVTIPAQTVTATGTSFQVFDNGKNSNTRPMLFNTTNL